MSSAPPPVANSGEDVILRTIDVKSETLEEGVNLEEAYEVEMTLTEIFKGGYERVNYLISPCTKPRN